MFYAKLERRFTMESFFDRNDWLIVVSERAEKCRKAYIASKAIVTLQKILKIVYILLWILEFVTFFSSQARQIAIIVLSLIIFIIDAIRQLKNKNVPDNGEQAASDLFRIQDAVQKVVFANKLFVELKELNPSLDSTQFCLCTPLDEKDVFLAAFRVCGFDFPAVIITDTICCKHLKRYINPEDNNYVLVDDLKLEELQQVIINVTFEKDDNPERRRKIVESGKKYRDYFPICIIDRNIPDSILGQDLT